MNLPKNVFGNSSNISENKIDITLFVQKHCLRTNYLDSNIEGELNIKIHIKIKFLPCLQKSSDAVWKSCLDGGLNHPSLLRNTARVDFNDKSLDNVRLVKINSLPAVQEHLGPKF